MQFRRAALAGHWEDPYISVWRPAAVPVSVAAAAAGTARGGTYNTKTQAGAATAITRENCGGEREAEATSVNRRRKMVLVKIPNGSVRASLGYLSTFEDVYALVDFLYTNYVVPGAAAGAGQQLQM